MTNSRTGPRTGKFLAVDDVDTQANFAEIVQHVATAHYSEPAVAKFLDSADSLLIAKARLIGAIVVTHELPNPGSKKRVLIPDVCLVFGVPFMNTYEALRQFSAKFVWSA